MGYSKGQYFAKPVFTQENSYSETFKEQLKMKVLCTVQYSLKLNYCFRDKKT